MLDAIGNIDAIMSGMTDFDIPGYDASILEELYADVEKSVESVSGMIPVDVVESIQKTATTRTENPPADDPAKYEVKQEVIQMQEDADKERPYITCPHCGVKIWV